MSEILLAIGLIFIIEGGLYAAFPGAMKRMMLLVIAQPADALRMIGFGGATFGVAILWFVRHFGA